MGFDHLTSEVCWTVLSIVGLLVVSSVIVFLLHGRISTASHSELVSRMTTWWAIFALLGGALLLSPYAIIWVLAFVSFLALREFFALVPARSVDRAAQLCAYASIPFQYYWVTVGWYGMFIIFVPVYLTLLVPTRLAISGENEGFLRSVGTINWGTMLTVFGFSHVAYFVCLTPVSQPRVPYAWPPSGTTESPGVGFLVMLLLLTELNDIAQFIWGKSLGRRKVAPRVSPGKTWAGLIGGVATTIALATLIGPLLTPMNVLFSAAGGAIIGVFGFLGDLSISALKRDLNVKDTGNMLPGHGGLLDRIDSLLFTAPLFFHFAHYCYF